jgi:site-specific DNA-cytosine methylase
MRLLSLFTGSGIGDYAAQCAGIEVVGQVESDPCCLFCLEKIWPDVWRHDNVETCTAELLARHGILPVDIIAGGFPCQGVSTAGKGKGLEDDRTALWFQMLRIIDEVRPAWVLAENSPALRVRGADVVLSGLEGLGYACWPVVVGTWACGQNHQRNRAWIVGSNADENMQRRVQVQGMLQRTPPQEERHQAEPLPMAPRARGFSSFMEIPRETDGLAGGLPTAARSRLLGMVGNSWSPQIPYLIFQWIVSQHEKGW